MAALPAEGYKSAPAKPCVISARCPSGRLPPRASPAVNLQDLQTAAPIRDGNDDLPVEPARTPQGRVRALGMVVAAITMTFCRLFRPSMEGKGAGQRLAFPPSPTTFSRRGRWRRSRPGTGCSVPSWLPLRRFSGGGPRFLP